MGLHRDSKTTSAVDPPGTALITGATGAIGNAIARGLAEQPEFQLILACRDPDKGEAAARNIRQASGNPRVRFEALDVASRDSVYELAARLHAPIDILINGAAAAPRRREETAEGIELQFATNVLGYFWMTRAFLPQLTAAKHPRIINIASYWAGGLDLNDPEFRHRPYDNDTAYRQSKQANRMLNVAFAHRLDSLGVRVNACHPGDVASRLSSDLGFGGHETPEQAARTPLWLATGPKGGRQTGKYFEHRQEVACRFASDKASIEALYRLCLGYD